MTEEWKGEPSESRRPPPGFGGVYGRRTGRKLRRLQTGLMGAVLPRFQIDGDGPLTGSRLFPDRNELRLEIGFGGGEHLAHHAKQRPDAGFIGCEPFRNGVAKFLELADAQAIENVRIHAGDAAPLLDRLAVASLAGVDLFYPDPWPKRRQRKRRFVSDDTLKRLARVMIEGAALRFATDIDDYACWTLARIFQSQHFIWMASSADDWRRPWDGWPSTRYEAKAFRDGRTPVYLTFLRTGRPFVAEDLPGRERPSTSAGLAVDMAGQPHGP